MKLELKGNSTYLRILSFQLTGHVVWCIQEPLRGIISSHRPPICIPGLDYLIYTGPGPHDITAFLGALKNYNLICSMSSDPMEFELGPVPAEFVDRIKLFRIKCYTIQAIQNRINWALEKNGLIENPIIDPSLSFDTIANIHQRQNKLTLTDSKKLVQFKLDEHKMMYNNIKYNQIEYELAVTNAKSVLEVINVYKNFLLSVGITKGSEEAITRFM